MNTLLWYDSLVARSHLSSCRPQAALITEHLFLHEELPAQWVNRSSEESKGICH
jgi:hypothetical protein